MIDTNRIRSGFDVEFQLGSGWFLTALAALAERSLLIPPGTLPFLSEDATFAVTDVEIIFDPPGRDLRIDMLISDLLPITVEASLSLSDDARSILPVGRSVAVGIPQAVFSRFANDIWHTQLTDAAGNHPFPDADNPQGDWRSVAMFVQDGRIRVSLQARAQVDSPLIDLIPDPDITITVDLIPVIDNNRLTFELETDANVDTGILGDLLAGVVGGVIGFVIGLFTGNPIGGAITGAALGIVVLEVGEVIVGNVIAREIQARIDGDPLPQFFMCNNNVVYWATVPDQGQGLNLGVLDTLPTLVPVYTDRPDPLHQRFVVVTSLFEDVTLTTNGLGLEGSSASEDRYLPHDASIVGQASTDDALAALIYRTPDGTEHELSLAEVLGRVEADSVPEPLCVTEEADPDDLVVRKEEGQLPVACMHPVAIRREATIITEIRFDTGLELNTSDTIMLQDAGALILPGLQLIRPSNGNPYYRSPPNATETDNFEHLPEF